MAGEYLIVSMDKEVTASVASTDPLEGEATLENQSSHAPDRCITLPMSLLEYSEVLQDINSMPQRIRTEKFADTNAARASKRRDRTIFRWLVHAACLLLAVAFMIRIITPKYCGYTPSSCPALFVPTFRRRLPRFDISSYFTLYNLTTPPPSPPPPRTRHLADTPSFFHTSQNTGSILVVAGKMSVEGGPCNIAQLNLAKREWSLNQRIQLSLYNSYSGGEVYSLLSNHTDTFQRDEGSGELIVVGAFDTTYRNSQVTYCSVGKWNGVDLSKVGEGLCNSALSKGMKITTAAFAGPQDVYVAGSFRTQVWNGDRHEFVKIFNIAHFNAIDQVWLPINVGQITCSWCTVTVLALAWDSKRKQLHVAGKFNAIDGWNVPAGLAIYDHESGHLVAHPGGGLSMRNSTQDGVGTALQLDEESGVLYVMGSFERLTATYEICLGLAAYEIEANRWTCLANAAHTVLPTGGGNMLLTPYGLMVAGETTSSTTWPDSSRPYTIALLTSTLRKKKATARKTDDDEIVEMSQNDTVRAFNWSWLPGFDGHDEPLHALSNGFGEYEGCVFIAGDNLVAMWSYQKGTVTGEKTSTSSSTNAQSQPYTEVLNNGQIIGAIMAIAQMAVPQSHDVVPGPIIIPTIIVYLVAMVTMIGTFIAIAFNRKVTSTIASIFSKDGQLQGIPLDALSYNALDDSYLKEGFQRALRNRHVNQPNLLALINPQEIFLQRIIGEGSFGKVWSAKWGTSTVAVKEFTFAQAAVAGKSVMQQKIIDEIVGEAAMMAILRHPYVLQLYGCSLTAQAIWIVSELCSLGSLRQLLDDKERSLSTHLRLSLALQIAEGIAYLHNQDEPIIHRDLKSHNIFVHETFIGAESSTPTMSGEKDENASETREEDKANPRATMIIAKIGDWGAARASLSHGGGRTMTHGVGTACWIAPETITRNRSSTYSDVYSYGIILWELWTREEVYDGLGTAQIIHQVANENLRPPVPEDCPWKDLMVRCWDQLPRNRPDFDQIVEELKTMLEDIPDDDSRTASSAQDKSEQES